MNNSFPSTFRKQELEKLSFLLKKVLSVRYVYTSQNATSLYILKACVAVLKYIVL